MKRAGWLFLALSALAFLFQWARPDSERDADDRARRAGL